MSVQAISWAMSFEAENATEKAVLFVLANYADGDGICYPGQQNVAKLAACSERSVRRVLDSLEERGVISRVERRRNDGSRTSDCITLAAFAQAANLSGSEPTNRTPCHNQPDTVSGLTTFDTSGDTKAAAARGKSDLDGLTGKLLEAANDKIQPHRAIVLSAIIGLIESGVDLETDILPTIRVVSSRLKRPAGSWGYFVPAIREAFEARTAAGKGLVAGGRPMSQPAGAMMLVGNEWKPTTEARWASRLNSARAKSQWSTSEWGPAPGQPGCLAPKHLLQSGDGQGWREWQSEAA